MLWGSRQKMTLLLLVVLSLNDFSFFFPQKERNKEKLLPPCERLKITGRYTICTPTHYAFRWFSEWKSEGWIQAGVWLRSASLIFVRFSHKGSLLLCKLKHLGVQNSIRLFCGVKKIEMKHGHLEKVPSEYEEITETVVFHKIFKRNKKQRHEKSPFWRYKKVELAKSRLKRREKKGTEQALSIPMRWFGLETTTFRSKKGNHLYQKTLRTLRLLCVLCGKNRLFSE